MEAIVDRIEGGIAVLEVDGSRFEDVALADLPAGTAPGDVLAGGPGHWRRDDAARAERQAENDALMDELFED